MARYIDVDLLLEEVEDNRPINWTGSEVEAQRDFDFDLFKHIIGYQPTVDAVEVVRCKDCKHFQPDFVWTDKGERRPYTEEEIKNGKIVTGDIGINCASRCERFGYWDENRIPVWFAENDFCSYGERKVE